MLKHIGLMAFLVINTIALSSCGQGSHFVDPAAVGQIRSKAGPQATSSSPGPTTSSMPSPISTLTGIPSPAPSSTTTSVPNPDPSGTQGSNPPNNVGGNKPIAGNPPSGQTQTQNVATCDLLAELIASAEDDAEVVTARVLSDGTCVINETQYAPGTILEITPSGELDDGTLIYVLRDNTGQIIESFYVIDNQVVVVVLFTILQQNPALNQPHSGNGQPAPQVMLTRQIHFETGKWNILKSQKRILDVMARAIEDITQNQGLNIKSVEIQGHTDDVGGAELNRRLSKLRAESVRAQLLKRLDTALDASSTATEPGADFWEQLLVAKGFGPDEPISGPSGRDRSGEPVFTKKDRTLNRRVEIHFIY